MTVFGWDASDFDWPRGPMDLAAAAKAGIGFFTHKATEATNVRHAHYGEALRRARDAGITVLGAYHVVRSPANAAAEVDYHLDYVDRQTPWWRTFPGWFWQVDLEMWPYDKVPASEGEQFADLIEARTGRRAIIYVSRGQYGNQLAGSSHPLWNANYGTNAAADFKTAYTQRGGDKGPGWTPYSGQTPIIWQYGSRTTIGRQPTCDANAYRGTIQQLRALVQPASTRTGDDDMAFDDGDHARLWNTQQYLDALRGLTEVTGLIGDPTGTGRRPNVLAATLARLEAAAAADATRDAATKVAIDALAEIVNAGGGDLDTAAILARIDTAAAKTGELVTALQVRVAELELALAAEVRDAVADLGEGGATQVRADTD